MRQLDSDLISFMKQVASIHPERPGFKYRSFEEFYLKKGHLYPHTGYTEAEAKEILKRFARVNDPPAQKQCFYNAQKLAAFGDFQYAEGYIAIEGMPIALHHAWAVYKGKPVDVTIRREDDGMTKDPVRLLARASANLKRAAYYGVEFKRAAFLRVWNDEGIARAMVEDWKGGFALLRGKK